MVKSKSEGVVVQNLSIDIASNSKCTMMCSGYRHISVKPGINVYTSANPYVNFSATSLTVLKKYTRRDIEVLTIELVCVNMYLNMRGRQTITYASWGTVLNGSCSNKSASNSYLVANDFHIQVMVITTC